MLEKMGYFSGEMLYNRISYLLMHLNDMDDFTGDRKFVTWESYAETELRSLLLYMERNISGVVNLTVDQNKDVENKLIFRGDYHLYDENGYDLGYEPFQIILTSSLAYRYKLKFKWGNSLHRSLKLGIKEFITDRFHGFMNEKDWRVFSCCV